MANTVWYRQPAPFGQPAQWVRVANITGGPRGVKGDKGERGFRGDAGPQGVQGQSGVGNAWTTGAGAPVAAGTVAGDMYLNTLNGDVYRWSGSVWVFQTNIDGPTGAAGATGPQGVTGPGTQGSKGHDGATWLVGTGAPKVSQGNIGDFYFQTAPNPTAATLIAGPAGDRGPAGPMGPPGVLSQQFTQVHASSGQSISNNTVTAVTFDTVDVDAMGAFSSATNTRLTAKQAGFYLIGGTSHWPVTNNQTTTRVMDFRTNGSTIYYQQSGIPGQAAVNDMRMSATFLLKMAAGDYVEMLVYQNDGGSISMTSPTYFWMVRLGSG